MERKQFFALPGRCKEEETQRADKKETAFVKPEHY
jgi:hypothetical protein